MSTLERHPRLLTYDAPAGGRGPLCSGAARASVALVDTPGGGPQVRHAVCASASTEGFEGCGAARASVRAGEHARRRPAGTLFRLCERIC